MPPGAEPPQPLCYATVPTVADNLSELLVIKAEFATVKHEVIILVDILSHISPVGGSLPSATTLLRLVRTPWRGSLATASSAVNNQQSRQQQLNIRRNPSFSMMSISPIFTEFRGQISHPCMCCGRQYDLMKKALRETLTLRARWL